MLPIDYEVILLIQIAAFYKVHPINKYGTSLPDKLLALILFVNCKEVPYLFMGCTLLNAAICISMIT